MSTYYVISNKFNSVDMSTNIKLEQNNSISLSTRNNEGP